MLTGASFLLTSSSRIKGRATKKFNYQGTGARVFLNYKTNFSFTILDKLHGLQNAQYYWFSYHKLKQ